MRQHPRGRPPLQILARAMVQLPFDPVVVALHGFHADAQGAGGSARPIAQTEKPKNLLLALRQGGQVVDGLAQDPAFGDLQEVA